MQEGERLAIEIFPILCQPTATVKPSDAAFDDPSFGHDLEADCISGPFDDFNGEVRQTLCERVGELRSLIAAIGEEFA